MFTAIFIADAYIFAFIEKKQKQLLNPVIIKLM